MGIPIEVLGAQLHQAQQLLHPRLGGSPVEPVHLERFSQQTPHGHARVERCLRVLEHDLHVPPGRTQRTLVEAEQVDSTEPHGTAGGFDEPQDAASCGRLPRPRFTDECHGLACGQVEAHTAHSVHHSGAAAVAHFELLHQIAHLEQWRTGRRRGAHDAASKGTNTGQAAQVERRSVSAGSASVQAAVA